MKKTHILICVATYNGTVHNGLLGGIMSASNLHTRTVITHQSSGACHSFNQMWQMALNGRDQFTHFVMIHSDVEPTESFWADKMVKIMEEKKADILSVVLPIKTLEGLTSTALDEAPPGDWDHRWTVRRLTMHEIYGESLPNILMTDEEKRIRKITDDKTFTHPKLLVNNGLMMVDMRAPWVEKVHFKTETDMIKKNGRFEAVTFSEDWYFSRQANWRGARIFATTEIAADHKGTGSYMNTHGWGTRWTDNPGVKNEAGHRVGGSPSSVGVPGTAV